MAYTPDSIRRMMRKNNFAPQDISYILRENNSTVIHLLDGRTVISHIPIGHFQDYLPQDLFQRVNKSVLLCVRQVVNVSRGKYLMTDGVTLEGRHHGTKCHTDFVRRMVKEQAADSGEGKMRALQEWLSAFDDMPVPFCIMQLAFDTHGRGTSFVFRYCNKMLGMMENRPVSTMMNRSFYDVFESADEHWLVKYGDVAKNGGFRIFHEYVRDKNREVTVACYQIGPGFCACMLLDEQWLLELDALRNL